MGVTEGGIVKEMTPVNSHLRDNQLALLPRFEVEVHPDCECPNCSCEMLIKEQTTLYLLPTSFLQEMVDTRDRAEWKDVIQTNFDDGEGVVSSEQNPRGIRIIHLMSLMPFMGEDNTHIFDLADLVKKQIRVLGR